MSDLSGPHGPAIGDVGARLRVWAPKARRLSVRVDGHDRPLAGRDGWFEAPLDGAGDGTRYALVLDGDRVRPDPASRRQPESVHGPSQLFDPRRHAWGDA